MSPKAVTVPEQGQLARVRGRQYVVSEVAKAAPLVDLARGSVIRPEHLVTLTSLEDDALGEELRVVWEVEPDTQAIEEVPLPTPTGFDAPKTLDAFLDAVAWGAASTADIRSVRSPFHSGIDIKEYQLDPVVRAVQMPRANLLIADDVGLGKTIEAGMVLLELIIRHRARRIMIVCPSSLQVQWRDQMRDKFGLEFLIVDSEFVSGLRRKRGIRANPWNHFPRLITSIDYLKRDRPLRLFRETLPADDEPTYPRRYDVLVLDEAHNVAPSGTGHYALDSLRTQAIRCIAPHFEHRLFLTATPHNGNRESFWALLELLDDQRFSRGTPPDEAQLGRAVVRRLKSQIGPDKRRLEPLEVAYPQDERAVHTALRDYTRGRLTRVGDPTERTAAEFVLKLLKKRLFSSPAAFATTLRRHEQSLSVAETAGRGPRPAAAALQRHLDRLEEDYSDDADAEEAAVEAIDVASRSLAPPSANEAELLTAMGEWAEHATRHLDAKARRLVGWLSDHIKPGGTWCDERVIIFTEYRDTQKWLLDVLANAGLAESGRLLTLYGGMRSDDREDIKKAFQSKPSETDVRILLATDAASEGIDLQNYCNRLIHYEIPWNPNRMEQRNGRIDRHGQTADDVFIYHFVGEGYAKAGAGASDRPAGDLEGDLEFLMRAARKVRTIREDLGVVGPVIARQVEEAMLGLRTDLDTRAAEQQAEPVRRQLQFERKLAERLRELMAQLEETKDTLHLTPEHTQAVVEVGLRVASKPSLAEATVPGLWPDPGRSKCPVFHVPNLTGSWVRCTEGLEHPLKHYVRPIVFDHDLTRDEHGKPRDDVVLVHLNHPLVQMCLRLLRAEVWSQQTSRSLHRMTARLVPQAVLDAPAVIAHARLVVTGGDRHRLHEEIISAGGTIARGRFSRLNVGQLKAALAAALPDEPSEQAKANLLGQWPKLEETVKRALEGRMRDLTAGLHRQLAERARKEEADIRTILEELAAAIRKQLDGGEPEQLALWPTLEQEQFQRNADALRSRLARIPEEIEIETEAVRARFADPRPRMFPIAVTFLVPTA